jgi:hypothetical protein
MLYAEEKGRHGSSSKFDCNDRDCKIMEVNMFRKKALTTTILALLSMSMLHHASAMMEEKRPEVKSDQPKPLELTEEEKKD